MFNLHKLAFAFFFDADLVESVERSAVAKLQKAIKPRCFKVVGCSTRKVWFHKRRHHRGDLAFFGVDSAVVNLTVIAVSLAANITAFGVGRMFA